MPRAALPTGTVTFLFTDVEGSTKLLHSLGAETYADALAEHRRILRDAFAAHGGVEVDTQGDAFFVAFPTAPGALAAAAEATQALASGPIKVRIGLHTGTPHLTDEGYVGSDVHRAARIAAAGHGDQILVSAATAQLVDVSALRDLGLHRLKDLTAPERIFQLGTGEHPPLKTLHQTNLPVPATPFLGRQAEVAEIAALLGRADARLVTLTGPGGTGKTRLALQAAASAADYFPGGVWWVPLAPLRDPGLVVESAATALGASGDLAEHIGDSRLLLLLDNFEHLTEAAPDLAPLLARCPNLTLLVTSREPLHLTGEHEYAVDPLQPDEAVELFLTRAVAAKRDFTADGEVAQICARLDHLPLAIELAAARVKVLSPSALLERLEQRLPLLAGGSRDLPERQRTLRATIEWSHELLTPAEQRLFARLAVFRGGCTLDAAEAIAEADLDTLQSLVDKSLARVRDSGRFWMLETIREFAAERLEASGEAETLRRRHGEYYLALAEEAEPHLRGDPAAWLDRLDRDHDNLRATMDRLEASGDGEELQRLVGALWRFYQVRGYSTEGRSRLETALALDARPTAARGKVLNGATIAALDAGDNPTARVRIEEALALHQQLGDEWSIAVSTQLFGSVHADVADWRSAQRYYRDALERFEAIGDQHYILLVKRLLAWMHNELGEQAEATALHEEVVRSARASGNRRMEATSLGALGEYALEDDRLNEAVPYLATSARISDEIGERPELVVVIWRLARTLAKAGRAHDAARVYAAAEALRHDMGVIEYPWMAPNNADTRRLLREQLSDDELDEASDLGGALSPREAIDLALTSLS
jgi:predicted ATPase/class 3 adenylate cyclase